MDEQLLCQDTYRGGCQNPIHGPTWYHEREWPDDLGRRTGPDLREGLPEHLVRLLAASTAPDVRIAVLRYADTPADVVDQLVDDLESGVRVHALTRTGAVALLRQAAGEAWWFRKAVAANPHSPADLLEQLSRDPDPQVRVMVVANPAAPTSLVDAAVHDGHEHVRWWALSRTRNANSRQTPIHTSSA